MRRAAIPVCIAVLALTALAPIASSSTDAKPGSSAGAATTTFKYPSAIRNEFVRGCTTGGGSKAACKCVIKKIERRYTLKQFTRIIRRVNAGADFPGPIQKIIQNCSSLQ